MAKYSDIKGFTVQTLAEDPITSTPTSGVWASGANLNTGRYLTTGCAYGYQRGSTLALCVGGRTPPENYQSVNEKYDGTSWTEVGDLSTRGRDQLSGFGTTTSAIAAGGYAGNDPPRKECESWDGSSWTEVGDLNSQTYGSAAAGVSNTSGLVFSGAPTPDDSNSVKTESWDGSSWTEVGDLNSGAPQPAGCGIQTAALSINGESDEGVESWNGSAWTEIADPNNTDRRGAVAAGSYTDAVVYGGGNPSRLTKTETYNGTAWTEVADMATASQYSGGGGQSNGFAINYGGGTPGNPTNSAATEEFQIAPITAAIKSEGQLFFNSTVNAFKETLTDLSGAAWASGGSMPSGRSAAPAGAGTQTAAVVFGGNPAGDVTLTYNGTAFATPGNNLSDGRYQSAGLGTSTAAFNVGGVPTSLPALSIKVESWDGSSWTEIAEINTGRGALAAGGNSPTSAAVVFGGYLTPAVSALTETWNGSSWTEVNDMNTARKQLGGFGTSTSAIAAGGYISTNSNAVESWDGTSWTEVAECTAKDGMGASGTSNTSGLIFGGSPFVAVTQQWDGTSWTERADLSTARDQLGGTGNSIATALAFGGRTPGGATAVTEEWTATLANKTITAS